MPVGEIFRGSQWLGVLLAKQPKLRGSVTTKHDKARVLHLFADPRLVLDLRKAYGSGHRRVDEEKTTVVK